MDIAPTKSPKAGNEHTKAAPPLSRLVHSQLVGLEMMRPGSHPIGLPMTLHCPHGNVTDPLPAVVMQQCVNVLSAAHICSALSLEMVHVAEPSPLFGPMSIGWVPVGEVRGRAFACIEKGGTNNDVSTRVRVMDSWPDRRGDSHFAKGFHPFSHNLRSTPPRALLFSNSLCCQGR
jgi:hypothetical protein